MIGVSQSSLAVRGGLVGHRLGHPSPELPLGERKAPPLTASDTVGMSAAIGAARVGGAMGEVPVGASVVLDDELVSVSHNETISRRDLTQHAEIIAIRSAMDLLGVDRLDRATLCVTLEPCAQCAGAIILARVGRVVFGAFDPKAGMGGSVGDLLRHPRLNHRPEVLGGVLRDECAALLTTFFEERR